MDVCHPLSERFRTQLIVAGASRFETELAGERRPQAFIAQELGHLLFGEPDSKLLLYRHDHRNMLERVPKLDVINRRRSIDGRGVKLKNLGEYLFQAQFVGIADHPVTAPICGLLGSAIVANQPGTARSASPLSLIHL